MTVASPTSQALANDGVHMRSAQTRDGAEMWRVARDSGSLELNSCYAYLSICRDFGDTCVVAERGGRVVGYVLAYRPPSEPEVVFVWQIGVDADQRGRGIAGRLLQTLVALPGCEGVRFLETTVTPDNIASIQLFSSFARRSGAPMKPHGGFAASEFAYEDHEREDRYRIGPLSEDQA